MTDRLPDPLASRLAAIVQSSDDAIVSKDLDGTIVTWNPAAERMFGYTAAEVIGRSIRIVIPADRQSEEDEVLRRIRRGDAVAHFETIRLRRDGTPFPISLSVSPVRDESGVVVGATKIARDITEREQAKDELAAAHALRTDLEHRLLALVAASGSLLMSPQVKDVLPAVTRIAGELIGADAHAVWRFDPDTAAWRVASSTNLSRAFTAEPVPGEPHDPDLSDLNAPIVAEDVFAAPALASRAGAFRAEGISSLMAMPLTLRGAPSASLVLYYKQPHRFTPVETQTIIAIANIAAAAITTAELYDEQRRSRLDSEFLAEAGRALSTTLNYEETLRNVAREAVPYFADWCAVDLIGPDGAVVPLAIAHVNPAKIDLARRFLERFPIDPASPYSVAAVLRTGQPAMMEYLPVDRIIATVPDEERRQAILDLHITSFMIVPLTANGRTFGALTFASAESGRRYSPADLAIAQGVASRAAMSADNARAYEEARRANRLKEDFIATLSHELRTPLNALLGYARMLERGMLAADQHAHVFQVIERNATSLARIVDDVLDMSRIASGKLRLTIQTIDVGRIVARSAEAILPLAEAKGVRLEITPAAGPILLEADGDRIQQVLWNLMSNGVKFTPSGGRVEVRFGRAGTTDRVEFVVQDTGAGISPDFVPHVFERFRQADSGLSREHGGLGLGLAVARDLVELHGGTLRAESPGLGHGATFVVDLPVRQSRMAGAPGAAGAPSIGHGVEPGPVAHGDADQLEGISILVLDDDGDALAMVRNILEGAGAHVTTATSARQGLQSLQSRRPDVILSDVAMPGMDGLEFMARVRETLQAGHVPSAALTAFTRPEDRARALAAGFDRHLSETD